MKNTKKIILFAGSWVVTHIFALHRNPLVWENPEASPLKGGFDHYSAVSFRVVLLILSGL